MRLIHALGILPLLSCASAPTVWAPVARPSPASCSAPSAPTSTPWQLVVADGFTFCVPSDWRPSDERTWSGGGGWVRWGANATGAPIAVRDQVTSRPMAFGEVPVPRCSDNQFPGTVDGQAVDFEDIDCAGKHNTSAQWRGIAIHLWGECTSGGTASLQLQVYRTVRVVPGPAR
jgi:hypothetical protein